MTRPRGGQVDNADDPFQGPVAFPVECYGQGETQQISQRAQYDPAALLEYLDRFIDIREDLARERVLCDQFLENQSKIEEASRYVEQIPQYQRNLVLTQSQIQAAEKANANEIINLHRRIEQERQIRNAIARGTQTIISGISQQAVKEAVGALKKAADPALLVVGSTEFAAIVAEAGVFEGDLARAGASLKLGADRLSSLVQVQLASWRGKEQRLVGQIEEKKRALEAQGIRLDMAYIQKLAADEARLTQDIATLRTWELALTRLWADRRKLLTERWATRSRIGQKRNAFAQKASATLRGALKDLNVSLKFEINGYSPAGADIIIEAMGWRTVQVPRSAALTERLTILALLNAIARKDVAPILALQSHEGIPIFNRGDATVLLERLSSDAVRFRLERCEVFDRPRLSVTKPFTNSAGTNQYLTREFRQLSLGQRQSVLLALMLSADSNIPLIIDQPEDNLDGEFIYQSLVPVLRRAKERRQVIVVTHNANIAVLGDAELIIVLRSTNDRGMIMHRGSIDDADIRSAACSILEGSDEAFQRRARVYGVPVAR